MVSPNDSPPGRNEQTLVAITVVQPVQVHNRETVEVAPEVALAVVLAREAGYQ